MKRIRWNKLIAREAIVVVIMLLLAPAKKVSAAEMDKLVLQSQILELMQEGNIYTVSQDGKGDFFTIQSAVESVSSGDTLLIMPGIYQEPVFIDQKTVNLIGTDKDNCIIQYDAQAYQTVPLNIAAGRVANLTIYGMGNRENTGLIENIDMLNFDTIAVESFPGYSIHIESNYSFGKQLQFINCNIVADSNYCVGMGGRGDFSVLFESCNLTSRGRAGCLYMHDAGDIAFGGECNITLRNCFLKNYSNPYVMSVYSLYETNHTVLTFQNVHVSTVAYENKSIYNDYNLYVGPGVDLLRQIDRNESPYSEEYQSCLPGKFVHELTNQEKNQLLKSIQEEKTLQAKKAVINEGISYLTRSEKEPQNESLALRIKTPINIWNMTGVQGTGWCGAMNVTLSKESFGNTLVEMNYKERPLEMSEQTTEQP